MKRTPLKRTKPLERRTPLKTSGKSRRPRMSADAKVQDAMLGKGRCWLTDHPDHRCTDGYTQRSHIVPQALICEVYEHGAVCSFVWRPVLPDQDERSWFGGSLHRSLQDLLDDPRNLVPTCPNGNVDGLEMVEALGYVGFPEGFDEFKADFGFEFNGRYWYHKPNRKPLIGWAA